MKNYFSSPIFILGLPRSGTSMIAGTLGICGAWTGSTVPCSSPVNPRGFFEHTLIREHVTKKILTRLGCDPLGVRKLPPVSLDGDIPNLADVIYEIIQKDGYKHDVPWLYKDAKLTLIWPLYKKAFPGAIWLVVRRDEEGFINSCLRTDFMKQHSQNRKFWKKFAQEYEIRINALKESGATVLEIYSPDVIKGDVENLKELISQLSLVYREKALKEFITPAYWHGNSNNENLSDAKKRCC
ncbi:MAG: hypothetical protein GY694_07640 [Gammaproteobacteria bacterium]|nr:hypothetical protein [Gammaproteobacteria bacterium]